MLLRFGVENHDSISTYQELVLIASTLKDDESPVISVGGVGTDKQRALRLLPVAGVYGANAAGKSTLLQALQFLVSAITHSHTRIANRKGTPYSPYLLDRESRTKPSTYDVDIVLDGTRYHYGFSLNGDYILKEWLFSFDISASRQVRSVMFARETSTEGEVVVEFPGKSLKGENKQISRLVRPNSLFLSVAAQNAHPQLSPIFDFFERVVSRLGSQMPHTVIGEQLTAYFGLDNDRRTAALKFLNAADTGISDIDFSRVPREEREIRMSKDIEQVLRQHLEIAEADADKVFDPSNSAKDRIEVKLMHFGKDRGTYPVELEDESTGTQALLQLLGPVFARLYDGGTVLIDELNTALHPLVSRQLVRLFQDPNTNPGHAQLIFTTHDTNLLSGSLLRRDQVWFVEKNSEGATHVYSLSDIKVRATDNIERGYLMGRFGAIPFMGCGLDQFALMIGQRPEVESA